MGNKMKLEVVKISSLRPDPQNARKHDERNIAAIAESLAQFGQRKNLVITHDGVVIAGNGTLKAAKQLGWTELAVDRTPKEWDEATARAYALADNQTSALSEWDDAVLTEALAELVEEGYDITALGFDLIAEPTVEVLEPTLVSEEDAFGKLPDGDRSEYTQMSFTVTHEQAETVRDAIARCKTLNGYDLDTGNQNSNGNALTFIAQDFIRGLG
jgi:ParB-like chromosome segregation protein Spo0J